MVAVSLRDLVVAVVSPCLIDELGDGKLALAVARHKAGIPLIDHLQVDDKRQGFIKTANEGIRAVLEHMPDYICLLNADALPCQAGWLARLVEVAEGDARIGLVGPSLACGSWPQRTGTPGMPPGVEDVIRLNFSCTVIRGRLIDEIGLLDERYIHYGGDYDYVHRAQEKGWRTVWVRDVYVWHEWEANRFPEWVGPDRDLFYGEWTRDGQRCE